jgi:hypothetical protein
LQSNQIPNPHLRSNQIPQDQILHSNQILNPYLRSNQIPQDQICAAIKFLIHPTIEA